MMIDDNSIAQNEEIFNTLLFSRRIKAFKRSCFRVVRFFVRFFNPLLNEPPKKIQKSLGISQFQDFLVVGVAGLEPAASWSRTKRDTKLRHTPKCIHS